MMPITPDPKDAAELERRRKALELRSRGGAVLSGCAARAEIQKDADLAPAETIATLTVPNPIRNLTVRLKVPKLMTWRLRLGIVVITTGCWIAGVGVTVETEAP